MKYPLGHLSFDKKYFAHHSKKALDDWIIWQLHWHNFVYSSARISNSIYRRLINPFFDK